MKGRLGRQAGSGRISAPPLCRDFESFLNRVSTYFVVVDQRFLHFGKARPRLWAEKVKCPSRHGFVIWTLENAYANPAPRRRKETGRNICEDSSDGAHGFQPSFATISPPVHPPTSFPELRRVTVTNLGFPYNTCDCWLSAPHLLSPESVIQTL